MISTLRKLLKPPIAPKAATARAESSTMEYTFYDGSIPHAIGALKAFLNLIEKAKSHSSETSDSPNLLLLARLAPTMYPLSYQAASVCEISAKILSRAEGGVDYSSKAPVWSSAQAWESLETFDQVQDAVERTLKLLNAADERQIAQSPNKMVTLGVGGPGLETMELPARGHVIGWGVPNLYFHLVTAYAILRKEGVDLGKMDYLSPFLVPQLPEFREAVEAREFNEDAK